MPPITRKNLAATVGAIVDRTPIYDIHTHIYDAPFGGLLLWGVDELLTYHYLVAEVFRHAPMPYERFWAMSRTAQADHIWEHLFVRHSPVSESCRGVLTCLHALGIDTGRRDLPRIRKYFSRTTAAKYVETVFTTANVSGVVMTNNPFDDAERPVWERTLRRDGRFQAALRMDPLLMEWPSAARTLKQWGYEVRADLGGRTMTSLRRFLNDWRVRMKPLYMAVSLPPDFAFPDSSARTKIIEGAILPFSREHNIPFAMMIGVKKLVNPHLRLAGDSVGKSDIRTVEHLCAAYPRNKFLVTFLARENQHEACITARKFPNLMLFGCWWFLNNPSLIEEMTRMRLETLGFSMIPQHSDARVLDQLLYKWTHSRAVIAKVLTDKYADLLATGWKIDQAEIARDVADLFGGTFHRFLAR
ncbi:MAG: glucuronate isomerase [Planctomycetota bacterium]